MTPPLRDNHQTLFKKTMRRTHKLIAIAIAVILILACAPAIGPASAPLPTHDANAPLTAIVLTAAAASTQTAIHAPPTLTPTLPTNTPSPTPTPTATFLYLIPTLNVPPTQIPLGVSDKSFECQVLSVEPKDPLAVSTPFIAKWVVANIGKSAWDENNADYRYVDGEKYHLQAAYDFPATVQPGTVVELKVDMQAPASPGLYPTVWEIRIGKTLFCRMELSLTVQ